jgi:WD40 repeat protein
MTRPDFPNPCNCSVIHSQYRYAYLEVVSALVQLSCSAYDVSWSPDDKLLAVAVENGDVKVWNLETRDHRVFDGHEEKVLRLNPDKTLLLSVFVVIVLKFGLLLVTLGHGYPN